MNHLELDHIVIGAATLEAGTAYVENALGVKLSQGGKHAFMATHNKLLRLGSGVYLEVIAIDPSAPAPPRPRWFNLDNPDFQASLKANPRIIHWVVRTRNIEQAVQNFPEANQPIVSASRGDLQWKITIPDDGSLLFDGAFPTFIEWPAGPHVSARMPDTGCAFKNLSIAHPAAGEIANGLASHLSEKRVAFRQAKELKFTAEIQTPNGLQILT